MDSDSGGITLSLALNTYTGEKATCISWLCGLVTKIVYGCHYISLLNTILFVSFVHKSKYITL